MFHISLGIWKHWIPHDPDHSLPEFLDCKLLGETILAADKNSGDFVWAIPSMSSNCFRQPVVDLLGEATRRREAKSVDSLEAVRGFLGSSQRIARFQQSFGVVFFT